MQKADGKRSREDGEDISKSLPPSAPKYGTQEYWEDRYKRHRMEDHSKEEDKDDPDAGHAWYFTYEELAPLILPLILGDDNTEENHHNHTVDKCSHGHDHSDACSAHSSQRMNTEGKDGGEEAKHGDSENEVEDEDEEEDEEEDDDDGEVEINDDGGEPSGDTDATSEGSATSDSESLMSETGNDDEYELVEVEVDEHDEEGLPSRDGLAKGGPIEILEVGCGDVPLGMDVVSGILEHGKYKGISPSSILKRVVCIDYSKSVIDALRSTQKVDTNPPPLISLDFDCEDARKLPYETGRFHLVLEKGTMDAMLSEPTVGADNCRAIVAEMARLVSVKGVVMIISHLNAHTEEGMEWFNTIVVPGLRKGSLSSNWTVEVHGGEVPDIPETENEEDEEIDIGNPGPAVYVIHKVEDVERASSSTPDNTTDVTPISLRFYSY